MSTIVAVDPGSEKSAFVTYRSADMSIRSKGILENEKMLAMLEKAESQGVPLAMEMVSSYGMPVGREIFETVLWAGRFIQAWGGRFELIYRKDVTLYLCRSTRAKDANIRQALLDRYPRSGGGKTPQIGTKKQPGPLYGFANDLWAALGVAVTCAAQMNGRL